MEAPREGSIEWEQASPTRQAEWTRQREGEKRLVRVVFWAVIALVTVVFLWQTFGLQDNPTGRDNTEIGP